MTGAGFWQHVIDITDSYEQANQIGSQTCAMPEPKITLASEDQLKFLFDLILLADQLKKSGSFSAVEIGNLKVQILSTLYALMSRCDDSFLAKLKLLTTTDLLSVITRNVGKEHIEAD